MNTLKRKRKKVWVQTPIQGALLVRTVMYWFFCLCTVILFVAVATLFSGELNSAGALFAGIWKQHSAAVLACVLLLPLVAIDVVRFSHRVVGPLVRLENEMRRLADGEPVAPIKFRQNDYWQSVADQFNRVAAIQQQLREQQSSVAEKEAPEYQAVV